jgi:asparagine synthase (glutamine-hydrolysing)
MEHRAYRTSGCGIVGAVNCEIEDRVFERMTDTLAHRGPDARGTWTSANHAVRLGHRRLAVVGVDERGTQPMTQAGVTITCNGEIYNYPELRASLEQCRYVFSSDCDTEVILHAYAEWGPDCVSRLNGIFAFGLYDERSNRLLLVRDRLGVKPLLICEIPGHGMVFGSEAKVLLACPLVSRRPDFANIRATLIHALLAPRRGTWLAGVENLAPGHMMVIDCGTGATKVTEYWHLPDGNTDLRDETEIVASLRATFEDAVRLQGLSDVDYCVCCSGGIDSASVAAMALKTHAPGLDMFTLEYRENRPPDPGAPAPSDDQQDLHHARLMAQRFPGLRLHEIPLSVRTMFDRAQIDAFIRAMDECVLMDARSLATAAFYARVREAGHRVALTGQGADEVWLGYYNNPFWRFQKFGADQLSAEYLVREVLPRWVPMGLPAWNPSFINAGLVSESNRANLEANYQCWRTDDLLNRIHLFALRTEMLALLHVDDRMSMMSGLEVRVPWLDHRLVEMGMRIPGFVKLGPPGERSKVKWLVRQAMRGILPDEVVDRPKLHFPEPVAEPGTLQTLVEQDLEQISKSPFVREMLTDSILKEAPANPRLSDRDLFTIYSLWRFGELHGF